jgi:hypothetical protein
MSREGVTDSGYPQSGRAKGTMLDKAAMMIKARRLFNTMTTA